MASQLSGSHSVALLAAVSVPLLPRMDGGAGGRAWGSCNDKGGTVDGTSISKPRRKFWSKKAKRGRLGEQVSSKQGNLERETGSKLEFILSADLLVVVSHDDIGAEYFVEMMD